MAVSALTSDGIDLSIRKTRAARKLRYYLEHICWPVAEPETHFKASWHIDAMCEHAQAVIDHQIRNLLVTVPPRHTKSTVMSVALPTWAWIDHPELRFLFASFSEKLSTEHAVLSRRVLDSMLYRKFWGDVVKLQTDQNVKTYYENIKRGYRISSSVGGTVVGRGGDILALDDPHNLQEIDSDAERQKVKHFYQHVWSQRFNDPQTGRQILIMQRGHEADLAGWILDNQASAWVHLNLPTRYEPTPWVDLRGSVAILRGSVATEDEREAFGFQHEQMHHDLLIRNEITVSPIGWKDKRTVPGELLNPERFGPDEVAFAELNLGPTGFATQHQQRPMPAEGGIFKRDKIKIVKSVELPKLPFAECRGWDQAATEPRPGADPDYTVGAKLRRYSNGLYVVMHVIRDRFGPEEGDRVLLTTAQADGIGCKQREEQEGGASGKKVTAAHERLLEQFDYEGVPKNTNKVVYAKPFATRWDAGEVWLLEGDWNQEYTDELCNFPGAKHDDQVDGSATAFHELAAHPVSQLTASEVLAIGGRDEDRRSAIKRPEF